MAEAAGSAEATGAAGAGSIRERGTLSADEQGLVAAAGAVGYGPFALETRFMDSSEFGGMSGLIQPLTVNGEEGHVLTAPEKIGLAVRGSWDGVREVDPHTGLSATMAYED